MSWEFDAGLKWDTTVGVNEAEQKLRDLEDNTTISHEDIADQSIELNRQLERSQFQHKSINNRLQRLRTEIVAMIEVEQDTHRQAEREAHKC